MKQLALLFTVALLFISVRSYAGFYIEPGVFYEKGDSTIDWPAPLNSSTGTTRGLGVDLKIGSNVFNEIMFGGLDMTYSKPKFENSANNYSADATSWTLAPFLGVETPLLGIRVWAGYVLAGTLDPDKDGLFDVKFEEAKGLKLGAGIRIFVVALNIEYMDLTYGKGTIEAASVTGNLDNYKNKVTMLSVSFPLLF